MILILCIFFISFSQFKKVFKIFRNIQDFPRLISLHFHHSDIIGVTAYFPLNKSKHSHAEYAHWIYQFFTVHKGKLIIYTPKVAMSIFRDILNKQPNKQSSTFLNNSTNEFISISNQILGIRNTNIIFNTTFNSPFEIPKLTNLSDAYDYQHEIDREKFRHNKYLYAIWNGKISLVKEAQMTYKSSYYYWIDIGSLREGKLYQNIEIPRPDLESILKRNNITILFGIVTPRIQLNHQNDIVEGTFFACSYEGVDLFFEEFWKIHDHRLAKGQFVGKDQEIYNLMFFHSKFPISILPLFKAQGKCNKWIAFYSFIDKSNRCNITFEIKPKEYYLQRIGKNLLND